ncbi:hypothetical protein AA106555_1200 [Neokomagataea thailandica NBRC 106555]|nr:hypothetical protein AA106555_1200 [Neokomagataea thailandica NBRC 106555]
MGPIPVVGGRIPGHPAGMLAWERLFLQWQPARDGVPAGIMLEAHCLTIRGLDGKIAETAGEIDSVLSLSPLLHGVIAPRRLRIQHTHIALRSTANGALELDLPEQGHKGRGVPTQLDRLGVLDIHDVTVSVKGLLPDEIVALGPVEAHGVCKMHDGKECAWVGRWKSNLTLGTAHTQLSAEGKEQENMGAWHFAMTPTDPSALGAVLPLAGQWKLPIALEGDALLASRGFEARPVRAGLTVQLGEGEVEQVQGNPIHIVKGGARIGVEMQHPGFSGPVKVSVQEATLAVQDSAGHITHLTAHGEGSADGLKNPRQIDGQASAEIDALDLEHLGTIWPLRFMKGARQWVTRNLTSGQGHKMTLTSHIHSERGFDGIRPTLMDGHFTADDVTVHWLRPVPPAEHASASLHFDGPETLVIDVVHGQQKTSSGMLYVPDGAVRIEHLYDRGPPAQIAVHVLGPLAAIHEVLLHPRLHLLSQHPLPFTDYAGAFDGHLMLSMPLLPNIRDDAIRVSVDVAFHDVGLGNVLLGRRLDAAKGTLRATEDSLSVNGTGRMSGIPIEAEVVEALRPSNGQSVTQDITARATISPAQAARAGLPVPGFDRGQLALLAHYTQLASRQADVALSADLTDAAISFPVWSKPIGEHAQIAAHLGLVGNELNALDGLQAHGRSLDVAGRAFVEQGHVRRVVAEGFRIGRSLGSAQIDLPLTDAGTYGVHVKADPLDLTPVLAQLNAPKTVPSQGCATCGGQQPSRGGWSISLDAPHVYFSSAGVMTGVRAQMELKAGQLRTAHFAMETPSRVRGILADAKTEQPFVLDIGNVGTLLSGLGLFDRIKGGVAHLDGQFKNGDKLSGSAGVGLGLPPFIGHVEIGAFDVLKPPLAVTVASGLSPLHWASTRTDRFAIQHFASKLSLANGQVGLRDGTIGNEALGATLEGQIGVTDTALALDGTIIPLFGLNAMPGHLPGVGKLFSPEKNGGLLAATFRVRGKLAEPALTINPFTILLPGALRKLVH